MKKLSLIGIILTAIGIVLSIVLFIIFAGKVDGNFGGYINAYLIISFLTFILVFVFCIDSINGANKDIYRIGFIISAIGIPFTLGITIVTLIDFSNKIKEYDERERNNQTGAVHNINYSIGKNEYRNYVNKYKMRYIIPIILSSIYLVTFVVLNVINFKYISYMSDTVSPYWAFAAIFLIFFDMVIVPFLVIGLVAPILALAKPSRKSLRLNIVFGILDLTFINSITSNTIIKEIEGIN